MQKYNNLQVHEFAQFLFFMDSLVSVRGNQKLEGDNAGCGFSIYCRKGEE